MPATRSVQVGERTVIVKELTVGAVRDWLVEAESGSGEDPLHALALDDCSLADLARMSDIRAADLEGYAPSDMAELVAAAKALNPHFFRVREALISVSRALLKESIATPAI